MRRFWFYIMLGLAGWGRAEQESVDARLMPSLELRFLPTLAVLAAPSGPTQTVTLSWTNPPNPELSVTIKQSTNLARPFSMWNTVTNVRNANSVSVPATYVHNFYGAFATRSNVVLAWDYPEYLLQPQLSFNVYKRPAGSNNWQLTTNVPSAALGTKVPVTNTPTQFAVSASNSILQTESELSNSVTASNTSGIHLKISKP